MRLLHISNISICKKIIKNCNGVTQNMEFVDIKGLLNSNVNFH